MMTRRSQVGWAQVKIGIVVVLALLILILMILRLEEGMGLVARKTTFHALVDNTQGLKIGGPVRMNGVDIGNIHDIAIATDSARVDIRFAVKTDVARHIREDASIHIKALGLLGDKFLEIVPGNPNKPPLSPGSVITGRSGSEITDLASDASNTFDRVNAALTQIQQALIAVTQGQGTTGKLINDPELFDRSKQILEKLDRASEKGLALVEKIEQGQGTAGKLIADQELYARAAQAVKELNDLVKRLNNKKGTLHRLTDPELYAKLDDLASRGDNLLNKVERGQGTVGKLVTSDELYARTDKLLREVEQFLADVKKNPTKYFRFSVF
jgi:phospholipid/cholesterol/gamma-HCH transport system substrate-binding protein